MQVADIMSSTMQGQAANSIQSTMGIVRKDGQKTESRMKTVHIMRKHMTESGDMYRREERKDGKKCNHNTAFIGSGGVDSHPGGCNQNVSDHRNDLHVSVCKMVHDGHLGCGRGTRPEK